MMTNNIVNHVAVDVGNLDDFIAGLSGSGWYLRPKSLMTIRKIKTAWLARPGTKMLVEVQEREEVEQSPAFFSRPELPLTSKGLEMIAALGIENVRRSDDGQTWFAVDGHRIGLAELLV